MCAASLTIVESLGCVSSSRICTRVRMGPTLRFKSVTESSTCLIVRRVCTNSAISTDTCRTSAMATTTPTQFCMHAPFAPLAEQNLPAYRKILRLARFPPVGFARAFHGCRNRFFLFRGDVLATLDQFVGAFAEFARFALRVVLAFIGFFREEFAGLVAGFRCEQNSNEGADTQADEKIGYFGTSVVRHKYLPVTAALLLIELHFFRLQRQRSTAKSGAQYALTAIQMLVRLS